MINEFRPLVLYGGRVCPNLNLPHSGWPYAPHPFGLRTTFAMSDQPIGFLPQPSDSAIGFHIAMTTGERTRLCVVPTRSLPYMLRERALPISMKADEAGLMIWG